MNHHYENDMMRYSKRTLLLSRVEFVNVTRPLSFSSGPSTLRERENTLGNWASNKRPYQKRMGSANSWPPSFRFFSGLKVREEMRHPALAHLHIPKGKRNVIRLSFSPYSPPCRVTSKSREKCFRGLVELS